MRIKLLIWHNFVYVMLLKLCRLLLLLLLLTDGMEVDAAALEAGQFEDADVDHW